MQDFNAVSQHLHKNVWMEIQLLFQTLCEKMHLKERMMAFNWQQYSQASVFLLNVIFFL